MHKNWNQRIDLKRDGRVIGVKFVNAEKYNSTIQMWEILSGTIHMNVAEYARRPTDKVVCRFEIRLYDGEVGFDLKPGETRAERCISSISNPFISQDGTRLEVPIEWIRNQLADQWITCMKNQGEPKNLLKLPEIGTESHGHA